LREAQNAVGRKGLKRKSRRNYEVISRNWSGKPGFCEAKMRSKTGAFPIGMIVVALARPTECAKRVNALALARKKSLDNASMQHIK
jgi:hypothetical protein